MKLAAAADLPLRAWQRRSSPLSRVACIAVVILIVDASVYPFTGWRELGVGPFDYLFTPWPHRIFEFDMVVNFLGYLPLGVLGVFALYPRLRNGAAALLVIVSAALLSACLEALQTYLPSRVASKVDLATNLAGAALGALLGVLLCEPILDRGRLREIRLQWFARDANWGIVIAVLWFAAILYPEPFSFSPGHLARVLDLGVIEPSWLRFLHEPSARGFSLEELVVSTCFVAGAGLLFLTLLRPFAPRVLLIGCFIILSGVAKTLGTGWTYAPTEPFIWITHGALESGAGALTLILLARYLPHGVRAKLAQLLLLTGLILVNLLPANPYFQGAPQDWAHGRLLNFYGLALGVSLAWPYVAFVYLARGRPVGSAR